MGNGVQYGLTITGYDLILHAMVLNEEYTLLMSEKHKYCYHLEKVQTLTQVNACFARFGQLNHIKTKFSFRFFFESTEHLKAEVKAGSIIDFNANIFVLKLLFIGNYLKYLRTVSIFHKKQYLGLRDLLLQTSAIKVQNFGCSPTKNSSIGSGKTIIVLYSNPNSKISARKTNTSLRQLLKGSVWFL